MNEPITTRRNRFTDSPPLQTSWLKAGLQSLVWLLLHPGAWRNHVHRLDPTLPSSFDLGGLSPEQQANPLLRRWIAQVLTVSLPIYLLLNACSILLNHSYRPYSQPLEVIFLYNALYILGSSLTLATTVSLPAGLLFGLGLALSLPVNRDLPPALPIALAAGMAGSSLLYAETATRRATFSALDWLRQTGSVLLLAGLTFGVGYLATSGNLHPASPNASLQAGLPMEESIWVGIITGLVCGSLYSLSLRIRKRPWPLAVLMGLVSGFLCGLSYGISTHITVSNARIFFFSGLGGGLLFALLFSLFANLGLRMRGPWWGGVLGALFTALGWLPLQGQIFAPQPAEPAKLAVLALFTVLLGLVSPWVRPILSQPLFLIHNMILYGAEKKYPQQSTLQWHAAFWDELQRLRWPGLENHLLLTFEQHPATGEQALQYLQNGPQQKAVQTVRLVLIAQRMGNCRDLVSISTLHRAIQLPTNAPPKLQLPAFLEISHDLDMALNNTTDFHSRSIIGQARGRLKLMEDELQRCPEQHAARFASLASRWGRIINAYLDQLVQTAAQQSIPNPYICGTPLKGEQKMFVGRGGIISRIEQLLLDPRHPPILVYGQRRMGKTSLLLNLGSVLPSQIVPCFVDCQGLSGSSDYPELFYRMGEQMYLSAKRQTGFLLPEISFKDLENRPFYQMDGWLSRLEEQLDKKDKFLLIKLDEFELLSNLLNKPHMSASPFLDLLRHTIQHRQRIKLLFACSHTLSELREWASYLVNTQVIKLSYLETGEAHQLIQYPLPSFPLRYDPLALNHMIRLTRGHPHLVQLLCYELVTIKNEQPAAQRYLAILEDVEAAARQALETGSLFFSELQHGQLPAASHPMLIQLAQRSAHHNLSAEELRQAYPQNFDENLRAALLRDIIEVEEDGYRFQVELVRRWFAQAGV